MDPKGAGSLYIRLLVNGVGALKCEDDTERMLFEVYLHYPHVVDVFV